MENPIKIDDLGGKPPLFLETPIYIYIYLMIMVSWCIGSCQRCDQKEDVLGSKEVRKYL